MLFSSKRLKGPLKQETFETAGGGPLTREGLLRINSGRFFHSAQKNCEVLSFLPGADTPNFTIYP